MVISLVSISMMDFPVSSEGWTLLLSLASATVPGLKPLSGIDTGNTDGRQSNTVSPTTSAGFCKVRSSPSSTASDNSRLGCEDRWSRLADFGVDPRPVFGVDPGCPDDGRRDLSLSM